MFACVLAGCGWQDTPPPPALHGARLAAVVDEVLQMPASAAARPLARINYLFAAPDASHRMFVADMAGKVYVVHDGVLRGEPFLDLAAARKGWFTSANLFEEGLATFAFHPDFAQPGRRGFRRFYTKASFISSNDQCPMRSSLTLPPKNVSLAECFNASKGERQ